MSSSQISLNNVFNLESKFNVQKWKEIKGTSKLEKLPTEMIFVIFSYLSQNELRKVGLCSKQFWVISLHNTLWKPFYQNEKIRKVKEMLDMLVTFSGITTEPEQSLGMFCSYPKSSIWS